MPTATMKEPMGNPGTQETSMTFKALGTPGAHHTVLARMAGIWKTRVRSWTEPGKPPRESTGRSEQKMILGGRYLQTEETGEMMGEPFKGMGLTGYDNSVKKYVSFWVDSLSTGMYYFEGTAGADGRSIVMEHRYDDPVRGLMQYRSVTRFIDDNSFTFELFCTGKNCREEKTSEITYTRER